MLLNLLRSIGKGKSGASTAEYALIVAILGGLVVAGSLVFASALSTSLGTTGAALAAHATKNAPAINK